ncbi:MAG: ABC transporter substrate-binding protein [Miniphocaeibacter sp.]|uniref:ABC transporter substrate-binding protein n=1 Tax=Miniphocaeibacter sp. TaxID=3100973 RepID=UPI001791EF0A|nr:ABC transporter substrate-binding protein [Gallicola sp.]
MKNLKKIALLLILSVLMVACSNGENNVDKETEKTKETVVETKKTDVKVGTIKGFPGIGIVNLMDENEKGNTENNYEFTIGGAPDELNAKLISGELDIATIPTNMAATLYNKTNGEIEILAVNTLGVIKLVSTDESIKSLDDIKGKEVSASGKGAIPQYTFEYILNKKGINPKNDVNITYYPGHEEISGLLSAGQVSIATIPEPTLSKVMAENEDIKIVSDLTDEWNKIEENIILSQGCTVISKKFAEENKEALNDFIKEYKKSCDLVHSDLENTAKNCGKFNIVPEKIALEAIPKSNQVYIDGEEMKTKLKPFFEILFDANPESVGGKLPDDNFYFTK